MRKSFLLALAAFAVFALTMYATPSLAVHKGSGPLTCGNCHTMHSSQGGNFSPAMGGATGSFILLRGSLGTGDDRANIHEFCLQCHAEGGAQGGDAFLSAPNNSGSTRPPKVYLTSGKWANGSAFDAVGAGGDFSDVGSYSGTTWTPNTVDNASNDALGTGHSLGRTSVKPPGNVPTGDTTGGGLTITRLTCTSCHDPHGTDTTTNDINKYRNLKAGGYLTNYLNSGASGPQREWSDMATTFGDLAMSYVGGIAGSVTEGTAPGSVTNRWPVWRGSGTQNYYYSNGSTTPGSSVVGISRFCAQCHGAWHEGLNSGNYVSDDWKRHPVANQLHDSTRKSGGGITIVDDTHYWDINSDTSGKRLPVAQNCGSSAPYGSCTPSASTYYADAGTDRVFCLSCHFAHGSPNLDILRWQHTSAVSSGSQTGVGIASDTGCQQCHNR